MKSLKHIFPLFLMVTAFSCQKVINVNLNPSPPQYVIEGNITDGPGPYTVKITQSIHFSEDNNFPGVSGATVFITDSTLNLTDTLSETSAGQYQTHILTGIPGHTYHLSILSGGHRFSSSSTMPPPVPLDSIYTKTSLFGNDTDVVALYKDPAGIGNYYHAQLTIGDSTSLAIYLHNDQLTDGRDVIETLNNSIYLQHGDTITVALQCIDQGVFQYYADLQQTENQNSASPANPRSNITGGALGYFSAHTVSIKSIVVP